MYRLKIFIIWVTINKPPKRKVAPFVGMNVGAEVLCELHTKEIEKIIKQNNRRSLR